jgi:hypothetical protein
MRLDLRKHRYAGRQTGADEGADLSNKREGAKEVDSGGHVVAAASGIVQEEDCLIWRN